jgi:hypothetical protein
LWENKIEQGRGTTMAKARGQYSGGSHRGGGGSDGGGSHGDGSDDGGEGDRQFDDPDEHREIEHDRFVGSLPPTRARYARAREQWSRLPGAVVRPPMDPVTDEPGEGGTQPEQGSSVTQGGKGGES